MVVFANANCTNIGTIKQGQIVTNAPSIWLYNQSNWTQCLCYALGHPPIVAFNSYKLNSSCQLFSNVSSYPFQINNNTNVTIYLIQPLQNYAPCCSNLTWLLTQIQSRIQTLSTPAIKSVVLDSINNRLGIVALPKLQLVSPTSVSYLNRSINLTSDSQPISYHQGLYYVGIFPPTTSSYIFNIYSASNLTLVRKMNFTAGGPQRIVWLYNDTLVCILLQTGTSTSKASFYNWPSNTLNQSITLGISNAYGLGKAPNNDTFVFITDGSWGGNVWQLKTTSPYNFTLFATSASSSESPTSVVVDTCNRLWVTFVQFGVRIYDMNSRTLLKAWNLTSTYPMLYDIVLTTQYQMFLADNTVGVLASFGSGLQCTN